MPKLNFNPATEIPSLAGKVILVTGGTAGLGRETILSFVEHEPAHIFFTGRSQGSAGKVISDAENIAPKIPVTFIPCDLALLSTVQKAAKEILAKTNRLDIVMANAGIMAVPHALTPDGYEIQFGTNHMGHALLLKLLTPLLESTAQGSKDVRIIWNTSQGYGLHPAGGILFDKLKTSQADISPIMGAWTRYGQSKLANMLYARSYATHHPTITSVAIHPGISATGLVTSLGLASRMLVYVTSFGRMISAEQCAWNQQWAATAPRGSGAKQVESGRYYEPVGVKTTPRRSGTDDELAEKLWTWTQKELEGYSV